MYVFPNGIQCAHRVWPTSDENSESSALKFTASYGPVVTNILKFHKIFFKFCQIVKVPHDYHAFHKIWL